MTGFDVDVVGSGPNGLAAAVTFARAGLRVRIVEAQPSIGGGLRSAELTLPGFLHDECAAVHPQAVLSPFFSAFRLADRIQFRTPEISYGHVTGDGRAGFAYRDLERTVDGLGRDGAAWRRILQRLVGDPSGLASLTMRPLGSHWVDPRTVFQTGAAVAALAGPFRRALFFDAVAPAMLAGVAAHVGHPASPAAIAGGLALAATAHQGGWPVVVGGSQKIADALAKDIVEHGGIFVTGTRVNSLLELDAPVKILNLSARGAASVARAVLPLGFRRRLERFRYGRAVCKLDVALAGPVPWTDERLQATATVHLGGSAEEVARAATMVRNGRHARAPFVLVSQQSLFDVTRAPSGRHTLWAYCHVPPGSSQDQSEQILTQIERAAPGFRDLILATHVRTAVDMAHHNENYVGGDILSGAVDLRQLAARPVLSRTPWDTPVSGLYLASASTAPGPAVHGMAGHLVALRSLRNDFHLAAPDLAPPHSTWIGAS